MKFQAVVEEEIDMRRRFFTEDKRTKFDYNNYLTIEALEDNVEVVLPQSTTEYGVDGYGWENYTDSIFLAKGQLLSLRGDIIYVHYGTIQINGKCNLLGNCLSLLYKDNAKHQTSIDGIFLDLFHNCKGIQNVSENFLPATTLKESCYLRMFSGCSSLITPPRLPATTLKDHCYDSMFERCYSLVAAPELPAITLVNSCYKSMFEFCPKLNYIKMLATDISADSCLYSWVNGVAQNGTFVKNPEATWEVYGISGIHNGWKVVMDGEESNLKSFQIDDFHSVEEFYFEDGMTWGEWVDSEYNNGDYAVDEMDGSICKLEFGMPVGWIGDSYGYVLSSDIILEETYYLIY